MCQKRMRDREKESEGAEKETKNKIDEQEGEAR